MKNYNEFTESEIFTSFGLAEKAASNFFSENFSHSGRVGFEMFRQDDGSHIYQFYSKDDPAMDDVFECLIQGQ